MTRELYFSLTEMSWWTAEMKQNNSAQMKNNKKKTLEEHNNNFSDCLLAKRVGNLGQLYLSPQTLMLYSLLVQTSFQELDSLYSSRLYSMLSAEKKWWENIGYCFEC